MKKLMSLMLALLMLALPVFSMAEATQTEQGCLQKYLSEGQQLIADVSVEPGILLLSVIPENMQTMVQDLLKVLKIEVAGQKTDAGLQGALRILLSDTNAAEVKVALGENGLYAASNFLGDKVVMLTSEQLENLSQQMMQMLVQQGTLTQEQLDAMNSGVGALQQDPQALIASLIGNPDLAGLQQAIMELIGQPVVEEAAEVPEEIEFEVKTVTTMVITKEALAKLMTELGKFFWSLPIVQQLAGSGLTEEALLEKMNAIPEFLAEDVELKIYASEYGDKMVIYSAPSIKNGDAVMPVKIVVVASVDEKGRDTKWLIEASKDEENKVIVDGYTQIVTEEAQGTFSMGQTVEVTENGTAFTPMSETIAVAWTQQDGRKITTGSVIVISKNSPEENEMNISMSFEDDEKDLGDHGEENVKFGMSMNGLDMVTLHLDCRTAPVDASIVTDSAVQPMAMTEEESQAFVQELQGNMIPALMKLISLLPENVQPLVAQLMNGGAQ